MQRHSEWLLKKKKKKKKRVGTGSLISISFTYLATGVLEWTLLEDIHNDRVK